MSEEEAQTDELQAILRVERETMAAIEGKDVAALSSLFADDFVYRTPGNRDAGKVEFLQNISSIPFEILSVRGEELRVFISGETAVLTGVQRAEFRTSDGTEGVSSVAFTDVLVKRGERWLMVLAYSIELPEQAGQSA